MIDKLLPITIFVLFCVMLFGVGVFTGATHESVRYKELYQPDTVRVYVLPDGTEVAEDPFTDDEVKWKIEP